MSGLTFGQPVFFLGLLLLLPLLILRVRAHFQGSRNMPGLVSPRLHKKLVVNSARATAWVTFALQCLGLASILAALARPQLGFDEIESQTEGRNLIIAIDTSRSMLADDLRPNRLTRAKLAAKDIILALPEDRVGLLAFAGRPFIQAPLTVDHEAVIESIDQLDTEIIPRGGTNIAAAARMAIEAFEEAKVEQSALVIFSDGEALEGTEEVEKVRDEAKEAGMTILSVGVGTLEGAIIPEITDKGQPIPGRFVMDANGQVVKTRLEPSALQGLASLGGTYIHLGGQASLTQVAQQIREGIATSREDSETRLRPIERFMWPLGASILFFVIAYLIPIVLGKRRRVSPKGAGKARVAVVAVVLLASSDLRALEGFENGYKAFEAGDYETALELYEGALAEKITEKDRTRLQMGVGATAYKLGDFERAAAAYGEALTHRDRTLREQAHYNLGNTLYQRGEAALQAIGQPANPDQLQNLSGSSESLDTTIQQWESAIEHYQSTLSLNEGNARATHNMEVVKKKLEELKQQQKEQEEQEKQEEEQKQEEEEKDKDKEEEESDEKDKQDKESEDQEEPSDGEPEENPDGEPEDKDSEGDPEEKPPGEDEKKPDEPEDEKENDQEKDQDQDGEEEKDSEGDKGEDEKDESPPQQPEGGEPEQPDEPKDGDLEADPNQEQPPSNPQDPSQGNPADMQPNPETGYSPSEARQLLDTLADETEVRPILLPSRGEVYKNW
ncbi:MAG: VWA domain-containing protein [Verrucomicrobiales bacterium]|nr:VWA domain-containing protein [Verrucomicrobiales bacterium]